MTKITWCSLFCLTVYMVHVPLDNALVLCKLCEHRHKL